MDYVCLWDICGHRTKDFVEMVRHISYHAYHARLLAIGYNARATLKLDQCKKDSSRRNRLPSLKSDHCCMWIGCSETFFSIQVLTQSRNKISLDIIISRLLCNKFSTNLIFLSFDNITVLFLDF